MILIIESGSTKTEWIASHNGQTACQVFTDGINPLLQPSESIIEMIKTQLSSEIKDNKYTQVYYYGAGCVSETIKEMVESVLKVFFDSLIFVETDLVAAARGLLLHEAGIACILGTGSNSCFYDGKEIIKNVRPLGYILGDEGSGSVLGKMFLGDCLKGIAPEDLTQKFFDRYQLSYEELIDRVYRQPYPNRFLAGFSLFLSEHITNDYVYGLVYSNFEQFFKRCIMQYNYKEHPIAFTGSIANNYKDILLDVAGHLGITIGKVMKSPVDGLIKYHS